MNPPDMLDYALGQLDGPDRERAERDVASDPALSRRLDLLTLRMHLLLDDGDGPEPPADLARRTRERVAGRRARPTILDFVPRAVPFRWADLAVAAGIVVAGLLTLLPAVQRSRLSYNTTACAANLRQLGIALNRYAAAHHAYPTAAPDCPVPFAGMYAVQISDQKLIPDSHALDCPCNGDARLPQQLPHHADLCAMGPEAARRMPCLSDSDYAYSPGRLRDGRYVPLPEDLDDRAPLLADRPPFVGSVRILDGNSPNHGGGGQNVLFAGGHVGWLPSRRYGPDDDIFRNRDARPAPALAEGDFVLLPGIARVDGR